MLKSRVKAARELVVKTVGLGPGGREVNSGGSKLCGSRFAFWPCITVEICSIWLADYHE